MTRAHTQLVQTRKTGASGEEKIGEEGGGVESEQEQHMTTNACTTACLLHNVSTGVLRTYLVRNMDLATHKVSTLALTPPAKIRYRA